MHYIFCGSINPYPNTNPFSGTGQNAVFTRLLEQDVAFFDRAGPGEITSYLSQDISGLKGRQRNRGHGASGEANNEGKKRPKRRVDRSCACLQLPYDRISPGERHLELLGVGIG